MEKLKNQILNQEDQKLTGISRQLELQHESTRLTTSRCLNNLPNSSGQNLNSLIEQPIENSMLKPLNFSIDALSPRKRTNLCNSQWIPDTDD